MSMSVEQRRTEVAELQCFPAGLVRLAKASSRFDRRRRYWVVEILPARYVEHELAEYMWRTVVNFAVGDTGAEADARAAFSTAWLTVRAMGDHAPA